MQPEGRKTALTCSSVTLTNGTCPLAGSAGCRWLEQRVSEQRSLRSTRSPRAPAYRRGVLPALRTTGRLCGRLHACHVSAMDEITKPSSLWKRLKGLFGAERTATEDSSEQSVDRESARTLSDASVGPLDDDSPIKTAA